MDHVLIQKTMNEKKKNTYHFHSPHFVWQHIPHTPHIQCRHCGRRRPPLPPGNHVHQLFGADDAAVIAAAWQPTLLRVVVEAVV